MTKLCELRQIGKEVGCQINDIVNVFGGPKPLLVIDYYEPPPTVELSDGRKLQGKTWDDEVQIGGTDNAQHEKK